MGGAVYLFGSRLHFELVLGGERSVSANIEKIFHKLPNDISLSIFICQINKQYHN